MQQIYSHVRKCVEDFGMISEGDRIAVGVSGGKDSLLTLAALAGIQKFLPTHFELEALTLDMGFKDTDFSRVIEFCKDLGVNYTIVPTQIAEVVFDIRKETNPCSLCAKMRRGALHEAALKLGCKKVALGHHMDDAIETFILSLLYEGRLSCFMPVTYLDRTDITLIRPLLYVTEQTVLAQKPRLPVVHNPCPANGNTKRQEVKEWIVEQGKMIPDIKSKLFGSLKALPGWATVK